MTTTGQRQSQIVRFGLGVASFLFLVGGPISACFLGRIFLEAKSSSAWPTVEGKLTRVQVIETNFGRFFADVRYSYQVNEQDYTGTRIRASDGEYDIRKGAEQAIRGLMVGQEVPVFYNPRDPRKSVLRAGAGYQEFMLLIVPAAMFLIGLLSLRRLLQTSSEK